MSSGSQDGSSVPGGSSSPLSSSSSSSNPTSVSIPIPQQPGVPDNATKGKTIYATFSDIPKDKQQPENNKPAKYADLADQLDFQRLLKVHERPCGREGLLPGIGVGAAVGGLRFLFGAPIPKAANWAVGTFCLSSIASFEYCKYTKRAEHAQVRRILEVYNVELEKNKREAEEAEKRKADDERRAEERRNGRWYKPW